MTEILTALQSFGTPGALLVAIGLAVKFVWPELRSMLRAQTAAFKALADLAARTDQRLANIERTTADTNEGVAVLLDRDARRAAQHKRPVPQGVAR